ncbi:MAG: hypothetical protein HY080_08705 [Gammaproteobacteria bacterium]|nr:hypothetical protein [Gammaproteobacteria bacterium]
MQQRIVLVLVLLSARLCYAHPVLYDCRYPSYSNAAGIHQYAQAWRVKISYNTVSNSARLIGEGGTVKLKTVKHRDTAALSFIEITPAGNVMTISIDASSHSVYSRNSIIGGKLVATQSYGTCIKQ